MAANARADPILIACLVDSSTALLHEWSHLFQVYILPLWQRIAIHNNAKDPRPLHETIRIGFVTYSDCHIHPNPILSRRFFAPVGQMTKELKDEPTSLGLGQTAPRQDAGMAVLEGYVAVLEMFDAVAETRPLPPQTAENTELPPYEPILYLLHIASTQPDGAPKPVWNQNCLLDNITWSSLPAEISKRKICHNMILTRPVPQLEELHKYVHGNPENYGIPVYKPSHKLLYFGLSSDVKTIPQKRAAPDGIETKPIHSFSPKVAQASVPPSKSSGPPTAVPNQMNASHDVPIPAGDNQVSQQVQTSTAPTTQLQQPAAPRVSDLNQVKIMIFNTEKEIQNAKAALEQAKAAGKTKPELDLMDKEINFKTLKKAKLVYFYQMTVLKNQAANMTSQPSQSTSLGPQVPNISTHVQPSTVNTSATQSSQDAQATAAANTFSHISAHVTRPGINDQLAKLLAERVRPPVVAAAPTGVGMQSQQPPALSQSQLQTQTQPQPQPQTQSQPQLQLQTQPQSQPQPQSLHGQPQPQEQPQQSQLQGQPQLQTQTQPQSQSQSQAQQSQSQSQRPSQGLGVLGQNPASISTLPPAIREIFTDRPMLGHFPRRWQGSFMWPGNSREISIRVALYTHDTTLHPEAWPQALHFVEGQISINSAQIHTWYKEKSAVMTLVSHTFIPGNDEATLQNYKYFKSLRDWCRDKSLSFYCQFDILGAPQGSGAVIFSIPSATPTPSSENFVCMIFNKTPLPAEILKPHSMVPIQGVIDQGDLSTNSQTKVSTAMPSMPNPNPATFLQQQKMQQALALQKRQEFAQQAQRNMMQNLVGTSMTPFGGIDGVNINQLLQTGQHQPSGTTEQMAMSSGSNVVPQSQPLMHRQAAPGMANLTAVQMAQLLQFGMSRNLNGAGQ